MSELNKNIAEYALRIGDTSLILGQRLAEWCGHGPILEEDIALTNISLDLIGQSRAFLTYAGEKEGNGRSDYFYTELMKSKDETFAALAEKSLKEVTYHVRHSSEWTIRFGDGTEESHVRTLEAVDTLWKYTGDLFETDQIDADLKKAGIAVDMDVVKTSWDKNAGFAKVFSRSRVVIKHK